MHGQIGGTIAAIPMLHRHGAVKGLPRNTSPMSTPETPETPNPPYRCEVAPVATVNAPDGEKPGA